MSTQGEGADDRLMPVNLRLSGRPCLLVGAGQAGRRKLAALVAAGALVTVIDRSPERLAEALTIGQTHDGKSQITCVHRSWEVGDSHAMFLTVAATDDDAINTSVSADARYHHSLVLRTDRPAQSDVQLPAVYRKGNVTVTVDTNGSSPTLAAYLRDEIAGAAAHWDTLADWAKIQRPVTPTQIANHAALLRREHEA